MYCVSSFSSFFRWLKFPRKGGAAVAVAAAILHRNCHDIINRKRVVAADCVTHFAPNIGGPNCHVDFWGGTGGLARGVTIVESLVCAWASGAVYSQSPEWFCLRTRAFVAATTSLEAIDDKFWKCCWVIDYKIYCRVCISDWDIW